jgi:hypothetical protein
MEIPRAAPPLGGVFMLRHVAEIRQHFQRFSGACGCSTRHARDTSAAKTNNAQRLCT